MRASPLGSGDPRFPRSGLLLRIAAGATLALGVGLVLSLDDNGVPRAQGPQAPPAVSVIPPAPFTPGMAFAEPPVVSSRGGRLRTTLVAPYETTADQTIAFGIGYDKLASMEDVAGALENKLGSVEAGRRVSIKRSSPVSVRVKDIHRLDIPGSFIVNLLADGKPIAKRAFFQPKSPRDCATCAKQALVNIDFRVDQEQLLDRTLSVEIEVPGHEEIGTRFPLAQAGNPTINARLLLDDE